MAKLEKIIKGLETFRKYHPDLNEDVQPVAAEHDILMVSPVVSVEGPPEMLEEIEAIGSWHVNSEFDCWAIFV